MQRRTETINRVRSGRKGMKQREIEAKYPKEKANKLVEVLKAKNLFYFDPDFPDDPEDPPYLFLSLLFHRS